MDRLIVAAHMVAQLQQQGNGKLGHRPGSIGGHVAHRDPPLAGGFDIHHVVACGQNADVPQVGAPLQHRPGKRRLVGQYHLRTGDASGNLLLIGQGCALVYRQLPQLFKRGPADVAGIEAIAIQHHDPHVCPPLRHRHGCPPRILMPSYDNRPFS